MDSITLNYSNESIPKPIENEFNSDSNAPIPAQNSQNCTPQEYNNKNFQSQPYFNNPNQPYSNCTIQAQVYSNNPSQPYSYCTNQPQDYPYNRNQQNKVFISSSNSTLKLTFLIISIILFLFVVIEIIVLIVNKWIGIILIHIDEAAILIVSILFFLSYFNKCKINPKIRTYFTGVILFVGFVMRGIAMAIKSGIIFIALMMARTFILILSIPISCLNSGIVLNYFSNLNKQNWVNMELNTRSQNLIEF